MDLLCLLSFGKNSFSHSINKLDTSTGKDNDILTALKIINNND